MDKEKWSEILKRIDTRTKVLALICLLAEALFAAALVTLPKEQTLYALIVCAAILIITIIAILMIELQSFRSPKSTTPEVKPSPLTPDSDLLNELVNGALQTVCRAVSIPETPESAKLRVFIFRRDGNQLVCSHYWAPNPARELVGQLRFEISSQVAKHVAVVQAVIDERITRTKVHPLPAEIEKQVTGEVSEELTFVLAAPIRNADKTIWGTVDFDAGNNKGKELLLTEVSDSAMFQLAQHLQLIISLSSFGTTT